METIESVKLQPHNPPGKWFDGVPQADAERIASITVRGFLIRSGKFVIILNCLDAEGKLVLMITDPHPIIE